MATGREGRRLGRPPALSTEQQQDALAGRREGISLGIFAKRYGVSRAAIQRLERAAKSNPER
jgi:putative DNA-invertase from lambdoid prophage Rac